MSLVLHFPASRLSHIFRYFPPASLQGNQGSFSLLCQLLPLFFFSTQPCSEFLITSLIMIIPEITSAFSVMPFNPGFLLSHSSGEGCSAAYIWCGIPLSLGESAGSTGIAFSLSESGGVQEGGSRVGRPPFFGWFLKIIYSVHKAYTAEETKDEQLM